MAEKSAGRYWKDLSEDKRRLYLKTYENWSVAAYAGRFKKYSAEKFEIVPAKEPQGTNITVTSRLIKKSGEPVEFSYKLVRAGEKWNILDIHISGVSQLALTRSQFTSILKKDGFDVLIEKMKDKIGEYEKGRREMKAVL